MKCYRILIFFLFFQNHLFSQNYVKNFGFEDYLEMQKSWSYEYYDEYPAKNWYSRFGEFYGTADFYVEGYKVEGMQNKHLDVPNNFFGFHPAKNGKAYAGIVLISFRGDGYREFLTGTLQDTLEAGKTYNISFFIRFAGNKNAFYSNKIEMAFNNDSNMFLIQPFLQLSSNNKLEIMKKYYGNDKFIINDNFFKKNKIKADVIFNIPVKIDTITWIKINSTYTAKGGEQFFTIGLFYQGKNITRKIKKVNQELYSANFMHNKVLNKNEISFLIFNKELELRNQNFSKKNTKIVNEFNVYYFIDDVSIVPLDTISK